MSNACDVSFWSWLSVSAAGLAIFLAGVLAGLKFGSVRRGSQGSNGFGGGNRAVKSPDLYIGNLTESVSGEELEKQFSKYGDVKEVRMVPPRSGEDKSFAFITMGSVESAQSALNGMNGRELQGRKIVVSEARSRRSGGRRGPRR